MVIKRDTTVRDRHREIIKRGHPPCAICGQPIDYEAAYPAPESFVVDHVLPLARGGSDTLDNKQASHQRCNRDKGASVDGGSIMLRSGSLSF